MSAVLQVLTVMADQDTDSWPETTAMLGIIAFAAFAFWCLTR